MEILDYAEVFDFEEDAFSHTEVILQKGQEFYRGTTDLRFNNIS